MRIKVGKSGLPEVKDSVAGWLNDPGWTGPFQQTPTLRFEGPRLNILLYKTVAWVRNPHTRQLREKYLRMSGINARLIEILSPTASSFSECKFNKQVNFDYEKITLHFPCIRVVDHYSCLATHRDW